MIDPVTTAKDLPAILQRRYGTRLHLLKDVRCHAGRITITRVTPVKGLLSRDRWQYNLGRGRWELVSSGRALLASKE